MLSKINDTVKLILTGILLFVIVILIITYPTMLLWNWLMPKIFGLTVLTFWETLGVLFLSGTLFKSSFNSNAKK